MEAESARRSARLIYLTGALLYERYGERSCLYPTRKLPTSEPAIRKRIDCAKQFGDDLAVEWWTEELVAAKRRTADRVQRWRAA